jgi:hypothetical protein
MIDLRPAFHWLSQPVDARDVTTELEIPSLLLGLWEEIRERIGAER